MIIAFIHFHSSSHSFIHSWNLLFFHTMVQKYAKSEPSRLHKKRQTLTHTYPSSHTLHHLIDHVVFHLKSPNVQCSNCIFPIHSTQYTDSFLFSFFFFLFHLLLLLFCICFRCHLVTFCDLFVAVLDPECWLMGTHTNQLPMDY